MLFSKLIRAIAMSNTEGMSGRAIVEKPGSFAQKLRANIDNRNVMANVADGLSDGSVMSRAAAAATRAGFIARLNKGQ